jgi:hypothetical protein
MSHSPSGSQRTVAAAFGVGVVPPAWPEGTAVGLEVAAEAGCAPVGEPVGELTGEAEADGVGRLRAVLVGDGVAIGDAVPAGADVVGTGAGVPGPPVPVDGLGVGAHPPGRVLCRAVWGETTG